MPANPLISRANPKFYYKKIYYFQQFFVSIEKNAENQFIGKGEAESSILSGSTRWFNLRWLRRFG
jgi:hypothetical protein